MNTSAQKIRFEKAEKEGFYIVLKERINGYFDNNKVSRHANVEMVLKTIFILSVFVGSYLLILSNQFSPLQMLCLVIINGFFAALIGLNIAHDAIHGSYSSKGWVNKGLAVIFNLIGANDYMWNISHNIVHHSFTNIPDHDEDIEQIPIIRLNPKQELWGIHKYQHIYTFFLYGLTSISWVFIKDFKKFFQDRIGNYEMKNPPIEYVRLFGFKIIYYCLFLVLPFMLIDLSWYFIILGFVVMHIVEGLTLALIFQLAHVVEGTEFPEPDAEGKIHDNWAAHQMRTTSDFATGYPIINFLFGGLNFQVEHHLFPKVCHIHYTKLAPIVKQTAEEFNLPYHSHKTFTGAIKSHMIMLKKFGRHQDLKAA
jgi:linoleoyl-CoA desaturase